MLFSAAVMACGTKSNGESDVIESPSTSKGESRSRIDYSSAKPIPLPKASVPPFSSSSNAPNQHIDPSERGKLISPGAIGDGKQSPEQLPVPR